LCLIVSIVKGACVCETERERVWVSAVSCRVVPCLVCACVRDTESVFVREKESVCVSVVSRRVVLCLVCACVREGECVCEREGQCICECCVTSRCAVSGV